MFKKKEEPDSKNSRTTFYLAALEDIIKRSKSINGCRSKRLLERIRNRRYTTRSFVLDLYHDLEQEYAKKYPSKSKSTITASESHTMAYNTIKRAAIRYWGYEPIPIAQKKTYIDLSQNYGSN